MLAVDGMKAGYAGQGDQSNRDYAILPAVSSYCMARGEFSAALPLLDLLESVGCGVVILDGTEKITAINSVAQQLLQCDIRLTDAGSHDRISGLVNRLLKEISASSPESEKSWASLPRHSGRPIVIFAFDTDETSRSRALILIDLSVSLVPSPTVLRQMFKLTNAEINLALAIASGFGPCEFASRTQVSRATARSQLASVFAKTNTRRQVQLAALLARISLLPSSKFSSLSLNSNENAEKAPRRSRHSISFG